MKNNLILLFILALGLSSCAIQRKQHPTSLIGHIYQSNINEYYNATITNAGEKQAYIIYPDVFCRGNLELIKQSKKHLLYSEIITSGENCTQGGYVKIELRKNKYFYYYYWPTLNDLYAEGELFVQY